MTDKQRLAAKKMVILASKTGDIQGIQREAMRQAGYSESSARKPKEVLTTSKAWPQLLEQYLPDDKLLRVHDEALQATKWNDFTGEREPDHTTRLKAVDMGYKVKGRLTDVTINQQFNSNEMALEFIKDEK